MRSATSGSIAVALVLLAACDGSAVGADAGADAASAPGQPAAPALTPCPMGWRSVADARGVETCDPWPATGRDGSCAADAMHLPGTPGCARIGTDCATDGWPSDLPAGATITYARAGATGGDGTRAHPYGTISDAIASASVSSIVAIAVGAYDEQVVVDTGITVWGACVSGTRLTIVDPNPVVAALVSSGTGGAARNLSITPQSSMGVDAEAPLVLTDVAIVSASAFGVGVSADVHMQRVLVRGTRATDTTDGLGVFVISTGSLTAQDIAVEESQGGGIVGHLGPLTLTDVVVDDTAPNPMRHEGGEGLHLEGCAATLRGVVLDHNHAFGAYVRDATSHVDAADLVVSATQVSTTVMDQGDGLVVQQGATFTGSRILLDGNHASGAWVIGGATLSLTDFVVRDTSYVSDGEGGFGIAIDSANVTLSRGVIEEASDDGMLALGGTLAASDVRVVATRSQRDGPQAGGLQGASGATVMLASSRIESCGFYGVAAMSGAHVALDDVAIVHVAVAACATTTCRDDSAAMGLIAASGGTLSASHFLVDDVATCGVVVGGDDPAIGPTSMDLDTGRVAHVPVGACVQVAGYDVERLHTRVAFDAVMVPLQATSYPLPVVPPVPPSP